SPRGPSSSRVTRWAGSGRAKGVADRSATPSRVAAADPALVDQDQLPLGHVATGLEAIHVHTGGKPRAGVGDTAPLDRVRASVERALRQRLDRTARSTLARTRSSGAVRSEEHT